MVVKIVLHVAKLFNTHFILKIFDSINFIFLDVNPCDSSPCGAGANCVANDGSFTCNCATVF